MPEDVFADALGRQFCRHFRTTCMECQYDFRDKNRAIEHEVARKRQLRKQQQISQEEMAELLERQRLLQVQRDCCSNAHAREAIVSELAWLERTIDDHLSAKMAAIEHNDSDPTDAFIGPPFKSQSEIEMQQEKERLALCTSWKKQHPDKPNIIFGNKDAQKIYKKFVAPPKVAASRKKVDIHTCYYCQRMSRKELLQCSRCQKVAYCGKDCQKADWKNHKMECVASSQTKLPPKVLPLTWEQVKLYEGEAVVGKELTVRAILDESLLTRQLFQCKDRVGDVHVVAAYTASGMIDGLTQGAVLTWKHPRFHRFLDGRTGARIEEKDLKNITVEHHHSIR